MILPQYVVKDWKALDLFVQAIHISSKSVILCLMMQEIHGSVQATSSTATNSQVRMQQQHFTELHQARLDNSEQHSVKPELKISNQAYYLSIYSCKVHKYARSAWMACAVRIQCAWKPYLPSALLACSICMHAHQVKTYAC